MNKFFVYAYLRKDRYSPYYIGKGCKYRDRVKHTGRAKKPTDRNRIVRISENLTEQEAFALEIQLIKFWGRIDTEGGVLYNNSDGGEGNSGYKHTEETKRICGMSTKGRIEDEEHKRWRAQLIKEGYAKKSKEEWVEEIKYRLECSTQAHRVLWEGVEYPSQNAAARDAMRKYNVSRNTAIRYIKEGRCMSNKKRKNLEYKGNHTQTKYV